MDKEWLLAYKNWNSLTCIVWMCSTSGWDMLCSYSSLVIAISAPAPWHTAESKQSWMFSNTHSISAETGRNFTVVRNMGKYVEFLWVTHPEAPQLLRGHVTVAWETKKEINHPHIFYSWGSPGNNPDPVDECPRLVDNDCSCLVTRSWFHFGQQRNEQNAFVTVEPRKGKSMHMFEANKEHKVILQSVKLIFQESVKGLIVLTRLQHTSQGQSKQLHGKGQPKALWLVREHCVCQGL